MLPGKLRLEQKSLGRGGGVHSEKPLPQAEIQSGLQREAPPRASEEALPSLSGENQNVGRGEVIPSPSPSTPNPLSGFPRRS